MCFVDANRTHIYRSNRCRSTIIYTHSTYVRDIAFNSNGTLFFSKSSGASSDGKIFEFDLATGDTRLHMTVPLSEVDGYWAGNFAFDPADTLFVSSGNRIPASIYRNDAAGLRKMSLAQNPITGFTFTGPDTLLYADHAQEIRELTAFGAETVVFRDPTATWLNDIAYGAAGGFPQQQDIDGDGEGDACDCNDSFMGENELGADCGGACGAVCDACVPVLLNGDPADNINIIFLPDKDNYTANMPVFRQNIRQVIEEAFRATPEFQNSECLFNFYYFNSTTDPADYEWNAGCVFNTPSDLYATGNCPAGGATASAGLIAAKGEARYCSQGNNFSFGFATDPATGALLAGVKGTVRHEFGHNKIELSDEYCCDGSYWQSGARPMSSARRRNARPSRAMPRVA